MQDSTDQLLATRLDAEPPIFRGCSSSELGMILGLSVCAWLPASLVVTGLLDALTLGVGVAAVGVLATVFAVASAFQRVKRNRPDGYYQQRIVAWLHDTGLHRSPLVRRSGVWAVGRNHRTC